MFDGNLKWALAILLTSTLPVASLAAPLKPRIVVLTDISPGHVEPDDMESIIRLFVQADLFEVEGLVATTGWSSSGDHAHWTNLIHEAIDERPVWVLAWGGGNTLAQALWHVREDRTPEQLKAFLHHVRVYTITDQDRGYERGTPFDLSSHQWMRRTFEQDLRFLWDESAWTYQNGTGKANWVDASASSDPDGDKLKFSWWVLSEAGDYAKDVTISGRDSSRATIDVPSDSGGKRFHVICEVTDDGTHNLSSYRRIILEPNVP